MLLRHQLEEQAPGERHHRAARDCDGDDEREVPVVPARGEAGDQVAAAVDEGREEDHAGDPETVAQAAGDQGGDHVARGHCAEQRGGDRLRLVQPVQHVEDDERARRRERPFPRRVGEEKAAHFRFLTQDAPAPLEVRAHALEHAAVATVFTYEEDRRGAGRSRDERGQHERRGMPDLQQEPSADESGAERDPSQHVLDPLRAAIRRGRQQVRIQAAVRRLVDVVREEEREDDQRRRPEVRHEREQQETEAERAERREHERAPTAERRVERVAPRADHRRQCEREHALRAENESDQRPGVREVPQERR